MRLSTDVERAQDEAGGIAVLHAALDAGVRLLDTADAYAPGPDSIGHNERLIAKALASWGGDAAEVTVATKGGLIRPGGQWVPDGRAKHLRAACEASLVALGVERIALYQLHAIDPKTPLKTSVRALAKLQRDGLVDRVGICNVNLAQLREAKEYVEVSAVQVELSPWVDTSIRGGVVGYCRDEGNPVLAHRPLGGVSRLGRLAKHRALLEIATRTGHTVEEVALAWLRSLADAVRPLPGPTRPESAKSCGAEVSLTTDDLATLDAAFPAADILRRPNAARRPPDDAPGDVALVMGMPGAGKSTRTTAYTDRGYERLNRDIVGGRLPQLIPHLEAHLEAGRDKVVLDNTYGSRARRNEVIEAAWRHGVPARCVWIDTPIERARVHAVTRMLDRYGRLLPPDEMRALSREDPNSFPPRVQIEYCRAFEAPTLEEGFAEVTRVYPEPMPSEAAPGRVLLLDLDKLLAAGDDAALGCALRRRRAGGWSLAAFAWRPGSDGEAEECAKVLDLEMPVYVCRHPAGPAACWCRLPMPGLALLALRSADASAAASLLVGATAPAERYAAGVGMPYATLSELRQSSS